MANEAVIIELLGNGGDPVRFTVGDLSAIPKGTLLELLDDRTVSGSIITTGDPFAGVAAAEKVAGDGSTTLALYRHGIFDLLCANGSITAGAMVCLSGANAVREAVEADCPTGAIIGQALETGSNADTIAVLINK